MCSETKLKMCRKLLIRIGNTIHPKLSEILKKCQDPTVAVIADPSEHT